MLWQLDHSIDLGLSYWHEWLQTSSILRLMIHVSPGAIITGVVAVELKQLLPAPESMYIGEGHHLIQANRPHCHSRPIGRHHQEYGRGAL